MGIPDIGVFLPNVTAAGGHPGDPAATARHAEALGFESVWVVDQLVAGRGSPLLDATVALGAAAGATTRIRLGFGVLVLPLHPLVWAAKQIASLQHISGNRVLLGVGVGGDRHDRSWAAAAVPRRERGRRLDRGLALLPGLVGGQPTVIDGDEPVRLDPPAPMPPVLAGGLADAALDRAIAHGAWFGLPLPPPMLADMIARLRDRASAAGRPAPAVTVDLIALAGHDADLPDDDTLTRTLTAPDGKYGMPPEAAAHAVTRGDPAVIAARIDALAQAGADRIVIDVVAGDWFRQVELLAQARDHLQSSAAPRT